MSHGTHPCPSASEAPPPDPATRALRLEIDPATGGLILEPEAATRIALALNHLAAVVHWSPTARPLDEAIAHDATWMAESLGDHARTAPSSREVTTSSGSR